MKKIIVFLMLLLLFVTAAPISATGREAAGDGSLQGQADPRETPAPSTQISDEVTNEGWAAPVYQGGAFESALPGQGSETNEGWVAPLIEDEPVPPPLPGVDPVTNEGGAQIPLAPQPEVNLAPGFFVNYTSLPAFQTAAGGNLTAIRFTELAAGVVVTNQYQARHAVFIDGNDTIEDYTGFLDDKGINGHGRVHIRLTEPALAIGADFPGAMTIELWDYQGGTKLFQSSNFGGSGDGLFGGVVTNKPFTYVILRDWFDDTVYLDNIFIKDVKAFSDYTSLAAFQSRAGENLATIRFTEVALGATVTSQYQALHPVFTDGNDVVETAGYYVDGRGLNGNGRILISLTEPAAAIGADFPGAMTIELWDRQGGTLLYQSSNFGSSGSGFFGGVVSATPFSFVVLRDWVDDTVYIDNLYLKDVEGFSDYRSLSSFRNSTGGIHATITFTELTADTIVTTQYDNKHVLFTDGNDVIHLGDSFTDGMGLRGNGRIHIRLKEKAAAIGATFPGAMTIELYDHQGGKLLYKTSDFGGSGSGFFGGVTSDTPFGYVILRDWVDDTVYIDNLYIRFSRISIPYIVRK